VTKGNESDSTIEIKMEVETQEELGKDGVNI
jgi:hypothetical protein